MLGVTRYGIISRVGYFAWGFTYVLVSFFEMFRQQLSQSLTHSLTRIYCSVSVSVVSVSVSVSVSVLVPCHPRLRWVRVQETMSMIYSAQVVKRSLRTMIPAWVTRETWRPEWCTAASSHMWRSCGLTRHGQR
jgi:hypothetical protein